MLIDGEHSMPKTIKTGAPQESVLGPVPFYAILFLWNICLNVLMLIIIFFRWHCCLFCFWFDAYDSAKVVEKPVSWNLDCKNCKLNSPNFCDRETESLKHRKKRYISCKKYLRENAHLFNAIERQFKRVIERKRQKISRSF